jgi:hypothetical protein
LLALRAKSLGPGPMPELNSVLLQVPLPVLGSWLRGCWLLTSMTHSASTSTIAAAVPVHAVSYMLSLARAKLWL